MRYVRWLVIGIVICVLAVTPGQEAPETFTLHVKVVDTAGQPVEGAWVILWGLAREGRSPSARTDAQGAVAFPDIPPGTYHFSVSHDSYVSVRMARKTLIGVNGQAELVFELTDGCQLFGRVTTASGLPLESDKAWIRRQDATGPKGTPVALGKDGSFTYSIREFGPRVWSVRTEGYGWVGLKLDPQAGEIIDGVEFVMEEPSGSVSGRTVGHDGKGVAGAHVCVMREDLVKERGEFAWQALAPENRREQFYTGADGSFVCDDIPAGRYYVIAAASDADSYRGHVGPIEVRPGERTANLRVPYDTRAEQVKAVFKGTLRGLDGRPLADCVFQYAGTASTRTKFGQDGVKESAGNVEGKEGRSGADGRFAIPTKKECDWGWIGTWGEGVLPAMLVWIPAGPDGTVDVDAVATRPLSGIAYRGAAAHPVAHRELQLTGRGEHLGDCSVRVQTDAEGRFGPVMLGGPLQRLTVWEIGDEGRPMRGEALEIPEGAGPLTVDVAFPGRGNVAGTLTQGGKPPDKPAIVYASPQPDKAKDPFTLHTFVWRELQTVVAAGQSGWRFDDLDAGAHAFHVDGTGLLLQPRVEARVETGETTPVHIEVPNGTTLSGKVVTETGATPVGMQLSGAIGGLTSRYFEELPLGRGGSFALENVPVGRIVLRAGAPNWGEAYVELDVPEEGLEGVELKLRRRTE